MRKILLIINILAFIGSLIWVYFDLGFESTISCLVTFGGLIGLIITKAKKAPAKSVTMRQKSGKKSKMYQSVGNMTIKND